MADEDQTEQPALFTPKALAEGLFHNFGKHLSPKDQKAVRAAIQNQDSKELAEWSRKLWAIRRDTVIAPAIVESNRQRELRMVRSLLRQFGRYLSAEERQDARRAIRTENSVAVFAVGRRIWTVRAEKLILPMLSEKDRPAALRQIRRWKEDVRSAREEKADADLLRVARVEARMPFAFEDPDLESIFPGHSPARRRNAAFDLVQRSFLSARLPDPDARAALRRLCQPRKRGGYGADNVRLWLKTSVLPDALVQAADATADEIDTLDLSDDELRRWLKTRAQRIASAAVIEQDARVLTETQSKKLERKENVPFDEPQRIGLRTEHVGPCDREHAGCPAETLAAPQPPGLEISESMRRALKAIGSLSKRDQALLMARGDREPYREIAKRLHISEGYARKRFTVLRDRLRRFSSTPG